MLLSLGLMIVVGLLFAFILAKMKLPALLGFIITGLILGPYGFNLIDVSILNISGDLRTFALVIILLRAGLSLDYRTLVKQGRPAILLTFLPATVEIIGTVIVGVFLLKWDLLSSLILGTIIAAVSPAVIVPRMIQLIEEKRGTSKAIPQMVMAGASADDVFVIVLFYSFISLSSGGSLNAWTFVSIPLSMITGVSLGILFGVLFVILFKKVHMRDTIKVLLIIAVSLLLVGIEPLVKTVLPFSALLSVIALGMTILIKYPLLAGRLLKKYEKIWLFAEMLLFILVGAAVNLGQSLPLIGWRLPLILLIILIFRSIGVYLSLLKTPLSNKEKLFVVFSYLPKATVQASIGAIPFELGLIHGDMMLAIAVVAILITAPIGALLIDRSKTSLLVAPIDSPNFSNLS